MKEKNSDLIILEKYIQRHGGLVAGYLEGRSSKEIAVFMEKLPLEISAEIIGLLSRSKAAACVQLTNINQAKRIIEKISPLKADVLLRNLDEEVRENILNATKPELAETLRQTLSYPKETVGANMNTRVFTIPISISAREALKRIKKSKSTMLPYVFVLNQDETLAGIAEFRTLIMTEANDRLENCVVKDVPRIFDQLNVQSVLEHEGWLNYKALPVVNHEDIFLGTILLENIVDKGDMEKERFVRQARMASSALGDLYKIGLGSFFRLVDEGWREESD